MVVAPGPVPPGGRIVAARRLLRRWPHLPAFWPDATVVPVPAVPRADDLLALPVGQPVPPDWAGRVLWLDPGPFGPPRLGAREVPAILLAAEAADPVAAALATPAGAIAPGRIAALRELLCQARIGSPPGLPEVGSAGLGCAPGQARILLDPCDGAAAARLQAPRPAAVAVRDPFAPAGRRPALRGTLPARLSPWTIIDAAAELHALPGPMARLAAIAGLRVLIPGADAPLDGDAMLGALLAQARAADPVLGRPVAIEEAIALLGLWRRQEAENRRIAVCLGMSFWKRRRLSAALASAGGPPAFASRAGTAIAEATRRGGAIAAWPSRASPALVRRAQAAGVPLVWVEDGFIRSAGLGAGFLPAASLSCDSRRPYFDPAGPSDLELILATGRFPPALLARAAALRAALSAGGISKYNLPGAAPALPETPGRRRILVPGQVEDDLSVLRGAAGGVCGNLDLLRAVRAANPGAFIAFKPHPDVEAGYRRGAVPQGEAAALADIVLARAPIVPLLDQVEEVHTITSLTGFEALLRGRTVACWGQPFYAGWGLTQDRAPLPRRRRRLTLDELVAGALILYPRYVDPMTELPCTPEALLERLRQPGAWRPGLLGWLRRLQGRAMARLLPGRG